MSKILRIMEDGLAPMACLGENAKPCPRAATCRTLGMWTELYDLVSGFLDNKTVADLMASNQDDND